MRIPPNLIATVYCLALFSCKTNHIVVGVRADAGRDSSTPSDSTAPHDSAPSTLVVGPTVSLAFGPVTLGSSSPVRGFTLTNTGPAITDPIVLSSDNGEFTIHDRLLDNCVSGVTTLAPGASCLVSVVFTPGDSGRRAGTVTFSAQSSGRGSVNATGEGTTSSRPATVSVLAGLLADRADGKGPAARFNRPNGLGLDSAGNLIVAEQGSHTIRKVTPDGVVTTLAGSAGSPGSADGHGSEARFDGPWGVAVDEADNAFVSDCGNYTIRKITPAGEVTTFAGSVGSAGSEDGTGADARFSSPRGVAVDPMGNILVVDSDTIRRITPEGAVTTLAGKAGSRGIADGTGSDARLGWLDGIAVDDSGWIYVGEYSYNTIRKISPEGVVTTLATTKLVPGQGDTLGAASFSWPNGVAVDGAGNLFVVEAQRHLIKKVTPAGLQTTLAGTENLPGSADGPGAEALFNHPAGIAVDRVGNVFVSDMENGTIRKISSDGIVTTLAGTAVHGHADGAGSAARFQRPSGIAVDQAGDILVSDYGNNAIRKISSAGVVTTLALQSTAAAGTGANQVLYGPQGLALDTAGNVFVATIDGSIQKVTPDGAVSTAVAGINYLGAGIAMNAAGDLFVIESRGGFIQKVTPAGDVSWFPRTGNDSSCASVEWTVSFSMPEDLVMDREGNLTVTDTGRILRVTPNCTVTALAGRASSSGQKDGPVAEAGFENPTGLAIDGAGNIFVADRNTIRKITPTGVVSTVVGGAAQTSVSSTLPASMIRFGFGLAVSPLTGDLYATRDSAVLVVSF